MECYLPTKLLQSLFATSDQCLIFLSERVYWKAPPFQSYIGYFFATVLLEAIVYFWFFRKDGWRKAMITIFALNLTTHPFVVYVWPRICEYWMLQVRDGILIGELFVPTVEALLLIFIWHKRTRTALLAAFLANFLSWYLIAYYEHWKFFRF